MSVFPNELDTDLELPRVEEEVTEISGDAINALRDAIFNIERTLGVHAQGNKPSLAARTSVSIDSDGKIKPSALEGIGLVTLPITDSQISGSAAIKESKLDLDFSTQSLKNSLNSLLTDFSALQSTLNGFGVGFNSHIFGQSDFHDGYQIKINASAPFIGVAGLTATTVGDAINEFSTIFITGDGIRPPHIDSSLPIDVKHVASYISVDSTNFTTIDPFATNVQAALDSIDQEVLGQQGVHIDNFHSNGILKEINSGEFFNANQKKLSNGNASYSEGSTVIKIPGITSFSALNIKPGDIVEVTSPVPDEGTFRIRSVGPHPAVDTLGGLPELDVDELSVFRVFNTTESAVAINIYKAASISSENAPLACSVRYNENSTIVDTISVLNPDAARVVSLGFNGAILNADGYAISINVGFGNGEFRNLTIPDLNHDRLSGAQADLVDAHSVVERINAYVSNPDAGSGGAHHFPISAYRIGNEIAIAHNLVGPEYTLEILDGYSGNFALGLDENGANVLDQIIVGNENNLYNVNGISRSSLRTVVDGEATITSTTTTFSIVENSVTINPINLGITAGSVLHITGHPTTNVNGTYTIESVTSTTVSVFSDEAIPLVGGSTTFNIKITDSHVSLQPLYFPAEDNLGLLEVYVNEDGYTLLNQRLSYDNSLIPSVEVINVSDGFPIETVTLSQTVLPGSLYTFNLVSNSVPGDTVTIDANFRGTLKLFHPNNIDFLIVKIKSALGGSLSSFVTIDETLNLDETMRLCIVHFDGASTITNLVDSRQFGNMAASQIRDDFIEIFSQRPVADLRSNGVARGFDVQPLPFQDSFTGMQALPLSGGVAYIDGVRVTVETQKVIIQSYDSGGATVGNIEKIICINNFGTIRAFDDELGEILSDGYNPSAQFGKLLPLYSVTLDANGVIDVITDLRLFINNLDDKVDLIVDQTNNVVGSFRSLEGALLYAQNYPGNERLTVKILNRVEPTRAIVVPDGVSIIGSSIYGGDGKHAIVNTLDLNDNFITLSGNNRLENIEIDSELVNMDGSLIFIDGSNINVEKCSLKFSEIVGSFTNGNDYGISLGANAIDNVNIINNNINNVFGGISSTFGCDNLHIKNNVLTDIVGFAAETYGIFVGNDTNATSTTVLEGNRIEVPSVGVGSDIVGIKIDVEFTMDIVRIDKNIINHESGDTMTGGIIIDNSAASPQTITNLFITNNFVNGIELDVSNIFGIYVDYVSQAIVSENVIQNIGGSTGTDTAFITIESNTDTVDVSNNTLSNGNVVSGINILSSGTVNVSNNIVSSVGIKDTGSVSTSTVFIRGNVPGCKVTENTLVGPGTYGIYWAGAGNKTQISNNMLKASSGSSFSDTGIGVLGTNVDIVGNTIVDMSTDDATGIQAGAGSGAVKIINNSVSGTDFSELIQVEGSDHIISNNKLDNTQSTVFDTVFIVLDTATDCLVSNNHITGTAAFGIRANSSAPTGCTVSNNKVAAIITTSAIDLFVGAADCFVFGNYFPDGSSNIIGPSGPSINTNLMGINRGLVDFASISIADGVPTSPGGSSSWSLDSAGGHYWESDSALGVRRLYFPISRLPNGTRLNNFKVSGFVPLSPDSVTIQAFRKSLSTGGPGIDAISAANNLGGVTPNSYFTGTSTTTGLVNFTTVGDENIITSEEYAYFILIFSSGGTNMTRISGIQLEFTY